MNQFFERKTEITKEQFLIEWETREDLSGHADEFTRIRYKEHIDCSNLHYVVRLTETGLGNVILPYHTHVGIDVNSGGELFWDVVNRYEHRIRQQTDACTTQIDKALRLINQLATSGNLLDFKIGRIFNNHALPAQNYTDHGIGKLYAGNFHCFVAYGLWLKGNVYRPVNTYYCEGTWSPQGQ